MFRQAVSFASVAADLHKKELIRAPRNPLAIAPFVVNSAFALELYLKTLNQLNGLAMKTHIVSELYEALPESTKKEIWAQAQTHAAAYDVTLKGESEIPSLVRRFDKTFVEWRYVYEKERSETVLIQPMILLMKAFHETYRKLSAT